MLICKEMPQDNRESLWSDDYQYLQDQVSLHTLEEIQGILSRIFFDLLENFFQTPLQDLDRLNLKLGRVGLLKIVEA